MKYASCVLLAGAILAAPVAAAAQTEPHQHPAPAASGWHFMQDGVLWLTYNNQGGPRGGDEIGSQNLSLIHI